MKIDKEKFLYFIVVCIAVLPILIYRDFTPSNELRYLSIADEALRSHTFFAFTNHGEPYADKPPLYIWAVMLCKWLTGTHHMWLLSLISLIPALVIVNIMDHWVEQEMDKSNRVLAWIMLLTSGLFLGLAVTLRMDMLMCMFIILSLHTFWKISIGNFSRRDKWLFPVYLFLAIFTKGPLGLLIPLCASALYLVLKGRIKQFFHYWNWQTWGTLSICCLMWFIAVYAEGGKSYLDNLLFHQTIDRAVNSFHHNEPFYYYAISIWYSIAPWSLLVIGIFIYSLRPRFVRSDLQLFFIISGASTFILLSCISSKLAVYLLPAFPFMVYAAVMSLPQLKQNGWLKAAVALPALIFVIALPLLAFAPTDEITIYRNGAIVYISAAILSVCGIHTMYILLKAKQNSIYKAVRNMAVGLLIAVFTGGWALPRLNPQIGYGALCDKALEIAQKYDISNFSTWHIYRAENMDVYLNHPVNIIPNDEKPAIDTKHPCILMLHKKYLQHFPEQENYEIGQYAIIVCADSQEL